MTNTVKAFRALHVNRTPLLLANAWDAGTARLIESLGAAAVATTSAGMAWSLGYRDGRIMPADQLIAAAARMARVVTVPLSIDIENGYSDDPAMVAELAMRLVDMRVAGINIEDGRDAPALLARKIEAIRQAVSKAGCRTWTMGGAPPECWKRYGAGSVARDRNPCSSIPGQRAVGCRSDAGNAVRQAAGVVPGVGNLEPLRRCRQTEPSRRPCAQRNFSTAQPLHRLSRD